MDPTAQIIIAVATLVTALGTVILGLVNRQTLGVVKDQTNGMLLMIKKKAHDEGLAEGRAEIRPTIHSRDKSTDHH